MPFLTHTDALLTRTPVFVYCHFCQPATRPLSLPFPLLFLLPRPVCPFSSSSFCSLFVKSLSFHALGNGF